MSDRPNVLQPQLRMLSRSGRKTVTKVRRLLGRFRRPKRFFAYLLLKIAYFGRWTTVPATPVTVEIEPINSCNFRCKHCQTTRWTKAKAQLDIDTFRRILDQLPNLNELNLQGMGEPLLNKQQIDLLAEGERRGLAMRFHSNGSACTESNARRLLGLTNTSITFSIDGASAETFERNRPGSNFAQIRRNIRYFTSARNGKTLPRISGWTVLTTDNIGELPQIIRLCGELGLDHVTLQPFLTAWGKSELSDYVATIKVEPLEKACAMLLREAHLAADAAKIDLSVVEPMAETCPWPWQSAYIAANGDVIPCSIIADADVIKMGNVFETPFSEIWNGSAYRALRAQIRNHDHPVFCQACHGAAAQSNSYGPEVGTAMDGRVQTPMH
jgi:radical SAM protein with 4Fe4S-binding SPASM domain